MGVNINVTFLTEEKRLVLLKLFEKLNEDNYEKFDEWLEEEDIEKPSFGNSMWLQRTGWPTKKLQKIIEDECEGIKVNDWSLSIICKTEKLRKLSKRKDEFEFKDYYVLDHLREWFKTELVGEPEEYIWLQWD